MSFSGLRSHLLLLGFLGPYLRLLLASFIVVQQMQESIHRVKSSASRSSTPQSSQPHLAMELAKELREIQKLQGHTDRVWSLTWNLATGVAGIPLSFASCSGDKIVCIGNKTPPLLLGIVRQFWMKRTPEQFDRVLGPHLGSYWPLQASMPPLQFGKMLEAITNVLPV